MKECLNTLEKLQSEYSYKNIYEIMCSHGDAVAAEYLCGDEAKRITYAEYKERVSSYAAALKEQVAPLGKGMIGLKVANCPDWPALFWSIMQNGYTPLLLDPAGVPAIVEHLMAQAGGVAIITDDNAEYSFPKINPADIVKGADSSNFTPDWADAVAMCTSGTTGTARVFVYDGHAMGNQIYNAKFFIGTQNSDIMYDSADGPLKNLAFLPFHHVFGFIAIYMWFSFFGKTIVYLADKNPQTIMATCRTLGVTHFFNVPVFWNAVAQNIQRKVKKEGQEKNFETLCRLSLSMQKGNRKAGKKIVSGTLFKNIQASLLGHSIRFMISGGGHVLPETLRLINALGYPLYNGFGMTEAGVTSVELSYDSAQRIRGSVGLPFESIEYKISDEDELLISGASLYSGQMIDGVYHKRESEWFSTGDLAHIDNGRLFIDGRLKEVIINESGENVYPDELEDYFAELPTVEKYCITGADFGGPYEEITLAATLMPGADAEAIVHLCETFNTINNALPMFKRVRRVLISKEPLPMSNGIKVQRQKLKKIIETNPDGFRVLDLTLQKLAEDTAPAAETAAGAFEQDTAFLEIKDSVRKIFADVLILDESEIGDFDHFVTDLGGDSLSVIGVIAQLEEKYEIFVPDTEFITAVNVQQIAELMYSKLYNKEVNASASAEAEKKTEKVGRITNFEDSAEFHAFLERQKDMAEIDNPYFVAHDSTVRDTSVVKGKEVINLGSYNYLGLSGHPETVAAACEAAKKYGTSASGSRTLAGEKTLYQELEATIAKFKHTEDAVVLTGGWATNVAIIGFFCGEGDLIVYDALSHNSIMQGVKLSDAQAKSFPHNDINALENILRNVQGQFRKVLIVVEGVYSMDGDIAPIPEFISLKKKYDCFLMVDEAHSSGVIGPHAGGVDDYFNLDPDDIDIKMGTLSKAFGTCGGYIAAKKSIIEYLKYSLPGFVFTAGISPVLAAACKRSVELIMETPDIAESLHRNIAHFVSRAKEMGMNTMLAAESAIVPIFIGEDVLAYTISNELLERGVFVPPAVYPAVARGQARLRFSISAAHSIEQLDTALEVLADVLRSHELI